MKITILSLLVTMVAVSSAFNAPASLNFNFTDVEYVMDLEVNGYPVIIDQVVSFKYNAIKEHITTFSGEVPAYDLVMNYTSGVLYQYFNLTGNCTAYNITKMNLTEYSIALDNMTEFVGMRGRDLYLFERKFPYEPESRAWIYGMYGFDKELNQTVLYPTSIQQHRPVVSEDISGEFISKPAYPRLSYFDFYYPACWNATVQELDEPYKMGKFYGLEKNILKASY